MKNKQQLISEITDRMIISNANDNVNVALYYISTIERRTSKSTLRKLYKRLQKTAFINTYELKDILRA